MLLNALFLCVLMTKIMHYTKNYLAYVYRYQKHSFMRISKKILACLLFVLWASLGFAQSSKLLKVKINNLLTIGIPEDFVAMTQQAYDKKYGGYRTPLGMFTSPDGKADIGINQMANRLASSVAKADWKEDDLKILQGMYRASIKAMHEKVDFFQDEIQVINKKTYIVFEFVGSVRDEDEDGKKSGKELKQYSYIQYTVNDKQVTIFNFTCPDSQRSYYQKLAKSVMQSIKFKN